MDTDFLHTNVTQSECTKKLVKELQEPLELFLYHKQRYNVPVTLILIYTSEDIKQKIDHHKRITDISQTIQLEGGYFNFVFLPFTDADGTYSFIKLLEKDFLLNTKHFIYFDELKNEHHNSFNFINNYLFNIIEQVECLGEENCQLPLA